MHVHRARQQPKTTELSWEQRWHGPDRGLIACWERGREKASEDPGLAAEAKAGRLVVLPWKGGVEKRIKGKKVGTLWYLAMWQGLRGDDLDIDLGEEYVMTCSKTGVVVAYTGDYERYKNA